MSLTQAQIKHLEKLTALGPSSKPLSIDSIVTSFDSIAALDTSRIHDISRSGKECLSPRPDEVRQEDITLPEDLLRASPERVVARQIALSGIMHTDE